MKYRVEETEQWAQRIHGVEKWQVLHEVPSTRIVVSARCTDRDTADRIAAALNAQETA